MSRRQCVWHARHSRPGKRTAGVNRTPPTADRAEPKERVTLAKSWPCGGVLELLRGCPVEQPREWDPTAARHAPQRSLCPADIKRFEAMPTWLVATQVTVPL